ncbi:MAG: uncharacterized protein QOD42_461 [Sphingomonadales bacterium]|jgi:hypothetical protein|nr:uncharacterized protein [Sphingomonadales bacterium]
MPMPPPPDDLTALSLADIARLAEERRLPPVEKWNPSHCGDSQMRIARDGIWYHEGAPIGRPAMVRLFSTILRREPDGRFVLVTPAEKLDIAVEDAPFVAVELKSEGEGEGRSLAFRLNTGDLVVAGPAHRLRFGGDSHFSARQEQAASDHRKSSCPHPYIEVRAGLDALLARPVYYELAEIALAEGASPAGVWSGGAFFALEPPR